MHLQSSLFTAVVFIALGFASENELAENLVKKSLTNIRPNLVNSANKIHKLVRRAQTTMGCTAIYNCPTAGQGVSYFEFMGNLQLNQNQGGTLTFTVTEQFGLWVDPVPSETIPVFPESFPVGWIANKEVTFAGGDPPCIVTWTLSINASMPSPNTLSLYDLQTNQIKETCGDRCSSIVTKFCTYTPFPITACAVLD
jgi:hypothetical protein